MKAGLVRTISIAALLTLGACQTIEAERRACASGVEMVETQLFFGLSKKSGEISPAEWKDFLNRDVVPRFAEGFSVLDGHGFWLSTEAKRTISEKSKVILRLHPKGTAQDQAIGEIVAAYKKRFAQESVLRVDVSVCAQF
ncbi:MAG: DUF3574 domain-containing protein [Alphaproteobacteria bacterium]|nr:DUF3574 domain-containing protein [Alphaproteobacteria bacterium]